jgi:hypothetical protein
MPPRPVFVPRQVDASRRVLSHRWYIDENIVSARTCSLELDKEQRPPLVGVALATSVRKHHRLWPVNTYVVVRWRGGSFVVYVL